MNGGLIHRSYGTTSYLHGSSVLQEGYKPGSQRLVTFVAPYDKIHAPHASTIVLFCLFSELKDADDGMPDCKIRQAVCRLINISKKTTTKKTLGIHVLKICTLTGLVQEMGPDALSTYFHRLHMNA